MSRHLLLAILLLTIAAVGGAEDRPAEPGPAPAGASQDEPPTEPADNLEYWLGQAKPAATQPADQSQDEQPDAEPTTAAAGEPRPDALPGVVQLSDGTQVPGWIHTTRETNLRVWVESEKRWRLIPLIAVLGIEAKVIEREMLQQWRWKEMGVPERVYTGKEYPTVRLEWKFHLIDGTHVTGAIKGQPLWIRLGSRRVGPFILHERAKGKIGESLDELIYPERVVISRRIMNAVLQAGPPEPGATRDNHASD